MNQFSKKILEQGQTNPQQLALVDELGHKLTYGELATLARQVASFAQKQQLPMAIPVTLPRRVETVAVFLGLNLSGRMFAPLSPTPTH